MKTYVLILSREFPAKHPRAGEPTFFYIKLKRSLRIPIVAPALPYGEPRTKIHTIRANYDLWKKRFDKIDKGEAELSIRVWEGKPYKSKQIELARLDRSHGIGIQKAIIGITNDKWKMPELKFVDENDNSVVHSITCGGLIAQKDGLNIEDWRNWFKTYDRSKPMAIIHFTPFRY